MIYITKDGGEMEHIYPAFERGRIMKKELLWALRDYSYSALQLQYQNYPRGIISGCKIRIEDNVLCIAPGIIKCQDFIFLFTEESRVSYTPTEDYISLKFRVEGKEVLTDYISYKTTFILDEHLECEPNEIEICRFKLKEGAKLRTEYKDFYDIQTEYDTVNLANATWSAAGQNTLSKEVTDYFAGKILECERVENSDIQFAYFLLQSRGAIQYDVLTDYIARKTGEDRNKFVSTQEVFCQLEEILNGIRKGTGTRKLRETGATNRMIIWD